MITSTDNPLRLVLLADAVTCLASGILMTLFAGPLAGLLNIPSSLMIYAGASLFPIAVFIAITARRNPISVSAVRVVIIGNVLWITGSLWLMLGTTISPNGLGLAYLAAQGAAVAILTWLEYQGVTRLTGCSVGRAGRAA